MLPARTTLLGKSFYSAVTVSSRSQDGYREKTDRGAMAMESMTPVLEGPILPTRRRSDATCILLGSPLMDAPRASVTSGGCLC
jgi:hypothetical protein